MNATVSRRLVPLVGLLFACGGDASGPDEVGSGEFSFTVSGAFSQTISGNAIYVTGTDGLAIDLANSSGRGVVLSRVTASLPAVGTSPIVSAEGAQDAEFVLTGLFGGSGSNLSYLCESTGGGTMTITASGSHLTGTFTTAAGCFSYSSGEVADATITGSFDAVEATQ